MNRFLVLKGEENDDKNKSRKKVEKEKEEKVVDKQNIFKQKSKPKPKARPTSNPINESGENMPNLFKKSSLRAQEKINLDKEYFPELTSTPVEIQQPNLKMEYLEKIRRQKQVTQQTTTHVPKGWVILTRRNFQQKSIKENINPYYNPKLMYQIQRNRRLYRDELNELLGDISPYWRSKHDHADENELERNSNELQCYSDEEDLEEEWW